MISDKESMMSKANYYIGVASSAQDDCANAASALTTAQSEILQNWQGASGSAMAQALADLRAEINGISARLDTLHGQMSSHANSIFNSWPEEIETPSPEASLDIVTT